MKLASTLKLISAAIFLPLVLLAAAFLFNVPQGQAAFPGANGKIAFESNRDGDFDILTMNPNGSGVTQLTSNSGISDRSPSWSADGTKIAYSSTQDGGDNDIWVMNADGSGNTQLTSNSAEDQGPVWSPDGTKIAFGSNQDGDFEIYVMNAADGSGVIPLTSNSIFDEGPAWSPAGTTIAFQSGADQASGLEIWKMNAADGSDKMQLTSNSVQDTSVDWAPDGSKLLFRRDLGFGAGWAEVFSMNPNGTGEINITNTATIFEGDGRFSPDGTKIVFSSNEDDPDFDLYVMNANGTGRTRLTNAVGQDTDADWQPLVDADSDGVPDAQDLCPTEDATGFDANADGCVDTIQGLIQIITTLPDGVLSDEIKTSLVSKVENAQKSSDKSNICAGINQLQAFINEVNGQRGNKISDEAADELIAFAQSVIAALNSQLPAGETCK